MNDKIEDLGDWMTEDEAREKWCPFSAMLAHTSAQDGKGRIWEGGYSYNRSPYGGEDYIPTGCKCIASRCMAWRKARLFEDDLSTRVVTDLGRCGMAGRG